MEDLKAQGTATAVLVGENRIDFLRKQFVPQSTPEPSGPQFGWHRPFRAMFRDKLGKRRFDADPICPSFPALRP